MGTDIHMAVEVYRGGKWSWMKDAVPCSDCDGTKVVKYGEKEDACFCCHGYRGSPGRTHGYHDRNYDAFGVLANVRNGTWGDETPFIAEPRGLPPFMDAELSRQQAEGGGPLGDHSQTWLTLAELLAFDWTQLLKRRATMAWGVFAKWDLISSPTEYCAGASGRTVTQDEAIGLLAAGESAPNVRATWTETLGAAAGNFHSKFIPQLSALAAERGVGANDLRIVFGFDS